MVRAFILFVVLILSFTWIQTVNASFCRKIEDHSICIERIKRSAKNYWEYRVLEKVDGKVRTPRVYNCRDRIITKKDGTVEKFTNHGIGNLICNVLEK